MERIDVALIGAGRMGQVHGAHVASHPALRLRCVIDPNTASATRLAELYGAKVCTLEQALADPAIAGVLVCSSTDQHLHHATAAVAAGKAVFCEKPIDLDLSKARQAQPQFVGATFLLGFNRRFDPHFRALKQQLDSGAIGQLESLHLINHDPAAPPPGFVPSSGGLFRDFTIHDLDLARWLLGEEIEQLYVAASCLVDPDIGRQGDVDTARTVLKTTSGRLCVISNTRRSGCGYDQRIEAYGAAGRLSAGNPPLDTLQQMDESGHHAAPIHPGFASRYAQAYANQIAHYAELLQGRATAQVGYADGMAALQLAEACEQSLRSGRAVSPLTF